MNAQASKAVTETTKTEPTFNRAEFMAKHGGTKSGAIRALIKDGKSRGEVAKLMGIRYQHVRNVMITPIKKAMDKTPVATASK